MLSKSQIARLRGLARNKRDRHEAGRFVVEGQKLVAEVLASRLGVHTVVADESWDAPAGVEPVRVEPHVLERIASTSSPQPVLAEVEMPASLDMAGTLAGATAVLVVVDLNDPGNVGTLARSAEASGFDAFVALGATADPWGPKAVRASAGALFRLPIITEPAARAGLERLASLGLNRIGTRMRDATPCYEVDLATPIAIVMGSEAHGLNAAAAEMIDTWAAIPMAGAIESLNVAMAGTILTYEAARQRRGRSPLVGSGAKSLAQSRRGDVDKHVDRVRSGIEVGT